MNGIYIITLSDDADNFDVLQKYFTNKDKAIKWLDAEGFEHLADDEYSRNLGYSIQQRAEIQILINNEDSSQLNQDLHEGILELQKKASAFNEVLRHANDEYKAPETKVELIIETIQCYKEDNE